MVRTEGGNARYAIAKNLQEKTLQERQMSQNQQILELLKKGPITAMDALVKANCFRLAARINDLKALGHNIITETIKQNGKHFARYRLIKAK